MSVFWDYIKCGFEALSKGVHPELDPYGDPWPPASRQADLAGRKIAGGAFFGSFWGASSDLEYAVTEWGVPHWSTPSPCLHCGAHRSDGRLNIRNVSMSAGWRKSWRPAEDRGTLGHPIWAIPGASSHAYRGDWMHTMEEGVMLYLHASCFHDLLDGPFNRFQSIDLRVDSLWASLQKHFSNNDKHLRRLTSKMVGGNDAVFPILSPCKAWESKSLISPLLALLREVDCKEEHFLHLVRCYECLEFMFVIIDEPGLFLDDAASDNLWEAANEFLQEFDWLTKSSLERGQARYNPTFKLHWMMHICWSARHLHPRSTWTYGFEDFCSRVKRLAISCMKGTPSHRLSSKIPAQYKVALHLVASR